jgi:acetyltransferase-like isoleucine patch superfamily enzyme
MFDRLKRIWDLGEAPADDIGARMTLGAHSYERPATPWFEGDPDTRVTIGRYTSVADEVEFLTGGVHPTDRVSLYPFRARWDLPGKFADGHPASRGDIVVGSDVWIARGATVLSGVTIGDGAVVGARAVVTRDVRPYAIVTGNPAREVGRRFPDSICERLLAVAWWDWPEERVRAQVDALSGTDVEAFLAAVE